MHTETITPSAKIADDPRQSDAELSNSFLNRFAGFGVQRPIQTSKKAVVVDYSDLDQRVRESGEW